MATLSTAARNAACQAIVSLVDAGTTNANGQLIIMTAGDVAVSTHNLSNPAFGAPVSGVATASAIADDTNAAGGTAALFKFVDRDGTEVFRGTVGTTGAELNLSSTSIPAGGTVQISSFTTTEPA